MSRYLLDTDTLSLAQMGHVLVLQNINLQFDSDIRVSAISIHEQMLGFLSVLSRARTPPKIAAAYDLLVDRLLPTWKRFSVLSYSETAIQKFEYLRSLRLNVGAMDLRIAAIALEGGLTVVTRNRRDFSRVPGLAFVDWSV